MPTIKTKGTDDTEEVVYNIVDRPSHHHEDLSPVSPQLEHIALVVVGQWGRHYSLGFSELRSRAAQRSRTDAYNLLIEAERLVCRWDREKDARCAWHQPSGLVTYDPNRPQQARRGRPPKAESAQADIVDVEFSGTVPASVKMEED